MENGESPGRRRAEAALWRAAKAGGAKEKLGLERRVLSSLTGLVSYPRHNPAMNRWAIFERPCGTHGTSNRYGREGKGEGGPPTRLQRPVSGKYSVEHRRQRASFVQSKKWKIEFIGPRMAAE